MKRVYLLLGGLVSADGWFDSRGMIKLAEMCSQAEIPCTPYTWADYRHAASDMRLNLGATILVGYSGGGSRATILNNEFPNQPIDLLVAYDPSPECDMQPINNQIKHAVCYHNQNPMMIGLGGGILTAKKGETVNIQQIEISKQHLAVQYDMDLHLKTMKFVEAVQNGK